MRFNLADDPPESITVELRRAGWSLGDVDGKKVMVGGFNFSSNAATNNDENVLVIDSAAARKKYGTEFERLWRLYSGEVGKPEKGDDDGK